MALFTSPLLYTSRFARAPAAVDAPVPPLRMDSGESMSTSPEKRTGPVNWFHAPAFTLPLRSTLNWPT